MSSIGHIAKIKCEEYTQENLPTGVKIVKSGTLFLCSNIELTYPVLGSLSVCNNPILDSSVGIVVDEGSRPNSFQKGPGWQDYDIMTVYIEGNLYKCFRLSLDFLTT